MKRGRPTGHYTNMERVMRVAEVVWGREQIVVEIDETHKDHFESSRKTGGFTIPARVLPGQYDRELLPAPGTRLGSCGPRTVRGELALLSMIFNWGKRHRLRGGRGARLIPFNPFGDVSLSCGVEEPHTPVMTANRHELMLKYAPTTELSTRRHSPHLPKGVFTALLELANGTAHRIEAILGLRVGDLLLTKDQVGAKLIELAWPEDWAEWWPYGAIFWNPEFDKVGYSRVTPISGRLHQVLTTYLRTRGTLDPAAWLFPAARNPSRCTDGGVAWKWIRRIEETAQKHGEKLPRLKWGAFHPFRRKWRSERAGYFDDKLIALVGGWKRFKDSGDAMQQGYLQYHPWALYLCAEFDPARDVLNDGRVAGVKIPVNVPGANLWPGAGQNGRTA